MFEYFTDEQFDKAIQKGIDEALAEIDHETIMLDGWVDQDSNPCEAPDWIKEMKEKHENSKKYL